MRQRHPTEMGEDLGVLEPARVVRHLNIPLRRLERLLRAAGVQREGRGPPVSPDGGRGR